MNRKYYDSLVGLRGLFILLIVLFHISVTLGTVLPDELEFIYTYGGYMGNYFFFMLSGFLIAHNYKNKIATNEIDFLVFIKKRLLKLYPLYIITNGLALLLKVHLNGWAGSIHLSDLIKVTFLTTTGWIDDGYPYNEPCWFISVLFLCYILAYFVFKLVKSQRDIYYLLLFFIPMWGYYLENAWLSMPFCYNHNGEGFLNFFIGIALYEILSVNEKQIKNFKILGILISIVLFVLFARLGFDVVCDDPRLAFTFFICPFAIFYAIHGKSCNKILCLKPFIWLGKISMSIFFFHSPLLTLFAIYKPKVESLEFYSNSVYLILYFTILSLVSITSYWLIEKKLAAFVTKISKY